MQKEIDRLINSYRSNALSKEEAGMLAGWLEESDENRAYFRECLARRELPASAKAEREWARFAARNKILFAVPEVAGRRRSRFLRYVAAAAVVVGIVVTMLYSRAVLTELSQQIAHQTSLLEKEQSEYTRLTAELDAKISLRNVEDYATQTLGMFPVDKSQVTYVDLSEGEKIELTSESPKQSLFDKVELAIINVKERLGED